MKRSVRALIQTIAVALTLLLLGSAIIAHAQEGRPVDLLTVNGAIDPWVDGYIRRGIRTAEREGAEALIIRRWDLPDPGLCRSGQFADELGRGDLDRWRCDPFYR